MVYTDDMGSKQRAWLCAGYGWFIEVDAPHTDLWLGEGQRPLLALARQDAEDRDVLERVFGWAMVELCEQRSGWISLVRFLVQLDGDASAQLDGDASAQLDGDASAQDA